MRLAAECERRRIWTSPDLRVRESDAADLMGLSPKTLRNRRSLQDPALPDFQLRGGRALYSLASILAWMASS